MWRFLPLTLVASRGAGDAGVVTEIAVFWPVSAFASLRRPVVYPCIQMLNVSPWLTCTSRSQRCGYGEMILYLWKSRIYCVALPQRRRKGVK